MGQSRIAAPLRVLIADSGAAFKSNAGEALTQRGHTVELEDGAEGAFEKVRTFKPDLIFYDVELGGYDGFEAVKLIAKMRAGKEGRIVASSMHKGEEYAKKALAAGAWDFRGKPLGTQDVVETAQAVKRHLRRGKELPEGVSNKALKLVKRRCGRDGCEAMTAAFELKADTMVTEEDQFETKIYTGAAPAYEFVDYNLLSVTVCPSCYWTVDELGSSGSGGGAGGRGFCGVELFKAVGEADDTLFVEEKSAEAALVAMELAIEQRRGAEGVAKQEELAGLMLRAASVAHRSGDASVRDRMLAEAEEVSRQIVQHDGCTAVYRVAYRLTALYIFFARDVDAEKVVKLFESFMKPKGGRFRPMDSRVLERYHAMASRLVAEKELYRRARYLER